MRRRCPPLFTTKHGSQASPRRHADRGRCGDLGQCVPSASPRTGGRSRRRSSSVPTPCRCSLRQSSRRRQLSSSCPSRCSRRSECRQATPESHVTHETWRTSRVSRTRWRFSVIMFLGVIVVSSAMRAATASSMSPFIAEAFPWVGQRGRWSAIAMARHVRGRVTESLTAAWDWWQERHMKVMGRVGPGGMPSTWRTGVTHPSGSIAWVIRGSSETVKATPPTLMVRIRAVSPRFSLSM